MDVATHSAILRASVEQYKRIRLRRIRRRAQLLDIHLVLQQRTTRRVHVFAAHEEVFTPVQSFTGGGAADGRRHDEPQDAR